MSTDTPEQKLEDVQMVVQEHAIVAGPMKAAAYRVRDPKTMRFGKLQFHMVYDNTVLAVMGEDIAKFFTRFVKDTIEGRDDIF